MKLYPRAAALAALALLVFPGHQPSAQTSLAALAEEFDARNESPLDDLSDRPLIDDAPRSLSIGAAREHGRWAEGFLDRLERFESDSLTTDEWITWAALQWEARNAAARAPFFWHEVPVTPYSSPLRQIESRFAAAPLSTPNDRERYLDGLHQLAVTVASMEAKLRSQAVRGIVLPSAEIDVVVRYLRSFGNSQAREAFVPQAGRLRDVSDDERRAFLETAGQAFDAAIAPAFERIATYVDGAYRARAGTDVGLRRYNGGRAYYEFLVRLHTGLDLSPLEIHEIGLKEVARLERELDQVRQQAGFQGTPAEFKTFLKSDPRFIPKTPDDIARALMAAAERIEPELHTWFGRRPRAPYGVQRLSPALEPSMTYGYYQRPTAGDPRGYYLFNGSQLDQRSLLNAAALSYHELVPGHHFQISLALENRALPRFRRNALYTAFTEGWGEYASDLAGEMGMYKDPYDRAGRLSMDLFLSTRLVVDTGMNALGWSRDRAMQYMRDHTFESEAQIATETLRYSSDIPGQALAYKMGSRTIRALRERTRKRLGASFDVRQFHDAVLSHGAMPLGVLERHLERVLTPESSR
jgi:uncharacterized protein (DUF885 family)